MYCKHFNEAAVSAVADGAVQILELAAVDRVLDALGLQLLFCLAYSGDFRVSERAPRKGNFVDVQTLHQNSVVDDRSCHDV